MHLTIVTSVNILYWPLHVDIVNHPEQPLTSRRPIWTEAGPLT